MYKFFVTTFFKSKQFNLVLLFHFEMTVSLVLNEIKLNDSPEFDT